MLTSLFNDPDDGRFGHLNHRENERHYIDVKVPEQEAELQRDRARHVADAVALTRAAETPAKVAGAQE